MTDGDAPRHILNTGSPDVSVTEIMNCEPIFYCLEDKENAQDIMLRNRSMSFSILDEENYVLDIVFSNGE